MKKLFTLLVTVLLTVHVFAQAPQKMSYQAVIRNSNNALVTSTPIGMKISIVQGSDSGTVVYSETQSVTTNSNGLASLQIGTGTIITGTFEGIDWSQGPYFIKTETDLTGGTSYNISGISEMMSVPYALFSVTSGGIQGGKSTTAYASVAPTITQSHLNLKENTSNKSSSTRLGTSNTLFPTQNAVKSYVDMGITAVTAALSNEASIRATADATLTNNLAAEVSNRTNADTTLTNNLADEVSNRTNADTTLQSNIDTLSSTVSTNATTAANATALKENSNNKSTDISLADETNTKFPTELAVKTYVDSHIENGIASNVSGIVAVANGGTGSSTQNFVDLTTNQTVAGNKTFTGRIFGKTAFLNGGDGTFGNAFIVSNNDFGFLASYNSLGTIRTGFLGFSSGNSVVLKAEETNSLILGAGNQNTLTLGADQKATFAGGAVLNGQIDINGSLFADNGTFSQRVTGKTAFLNGGDGTFGNAFIVSNNDSGFLASYNSSGTIRTGFLGFSSGNSVVLKAEETNSLILGAGNQNTLTLGADQNATFSGNIIGASFIKSGGTASQFLKADGTVDSSTYLTSAGTATNVSGVVALANGGTGSTTQNFVDLTTDQSIAGSKTFTVDLTVNGLTIGKGAGAGNYNTALGTGTLRGNTGSNNTAVGSESQYAAAGMSGNDNTSMGSSALYYNQSGSSNTAIGYQSLFYNENSNNTAIGNLTLLNNVSGIGNTAIGYGANVGSDALNNASAIGNGAIVAASNTIQLGNTSVTDVKTSGTLTAGTVTYPNAHNSIDGQVLTTNASGVASWAAPTSVTEADDQLFATAGQTSFTLSQTPSANSKVKMYINGIRINKLAYSVNVDTLTYEPANNGAYTISLDDRVQFEYTY